MSRIENFWNKNNSNWLDKNKDNINLNWRPRKLFSTVNAELKEKWITALTKEQLIEAYWLVFNTDEEELRRISLDKTYPFALRLIILELNNKNNRAKAMSDYRDYMFWKAIQKVEWQQETTLNIISWEDKKLLNEVINDNLWIE